MAVDQRDCYAAFGPSHRRKAPSIESRSTLTRSCTSASSVRESISSAATSFTHSAPKSPKLDSRVESSAAADAEASIESADKATAPLCLSNYFSSPARNSPARIDPLHRGVTYAPQCIRSPRRPATGPPPTQSQPGSAEGPDEDEAWHGDPRLASLRGLFQRTRKLLGSMCILDARAAGGTSVPVTTDDAMARHVTLDVQCPLDPDTTEKWWLQTAPAAAPSSDEPDRRLYLLIQRPLASPGGSCALSLLSRVDVTDLAYPDGFMESLSDVWLDLAADELRHRPAGALPRVRPLPSRRLLAPADLQGSVERIRGLYARFFILEPRNGPLGFGVSFVSAGLDDTDKRQIAGIARAVDGGVYNIGRHLAGNLRFLFDARLDLDRAHELVWCVPLVGKGMKCWVCFVLAGVA